MFWLLSILVFCIVVFLGTTTLRACSPSKKYEPTEFVSSVFSYRFEDARERFVQAAEGAGARLKSYAHPESSPNGQSLSMDTAYLGPSKPEVLLLVASATHGIEGYAGSAIQIDRMASDAFANLPAGVGVLLVHGINAWGMSTYRRTNEHNVDLNRNFRNHALSAPHNPAYDGLANMAAPHSINFFAEVWHWGRTYLYILVNGFDAAKQAISQGQYSDPDGLFYGGAKQEWSNAIVYKILAEFEDLKKLIAIDIHTGLGEFGSSELITHVPEVTSAYKEITVIWGEDWVRSSYDCQSVSVRLDSTMLQGIEKKFGDSVVTGAALEIGTRPTMQVYKALRAENWHNRFGNGDTSPTNMYKACIFDAFYPNDPAWRDAVLAHGQRAVAMALDYASKQLDG